MTNQLWGELGKVNVNDIPGRDLESGRFYDLWREVELRLEQTPKTHAITIAFETKSLARKAEMALRRYVTTRWKAQKHMKISNRPNGEGYMLYVRRGENWKKRVIVQ